MPDQTPPPAPTTSAAPPAEPEPQAVRRAVAASAIGNATEWFDYGIYAYGVSYLSASIFPGDTEQATLFALATFAVSFLVRPLGGLVWGPLGDRIGRKAVLALTILLMSAATLGVGLVPSYDAIGWLAPTLLVTLRMVQGFSTGGEYGGAATFMAEYAPDKRRGFFGSFLELGTLAGYAAGALLMLGFSLALSESAMESWGWRVPFLVAAPLGLVGVYLRSRLSDTPVFEEAAEQDATEDDAVTSQLGTLVSRQWRPLLVLAGLVAALNVVNYTLLTYMPTYLDATIGLTTQQSLLVPVIGMLVMMPFLPLVGALSDRVGRKPLWWASLVGLTVMSVPMFLLIGTSMAGAVVGFLVLGLLFAPQLATISATFPAMLPTPYRFAGFALAYNVSTSIFGGTAPALNDWLVQATGTDLVPAFLMMAACAVGAVALVFVVETAGASLRGTEVPGTEESERELAAMDR